MGEGSRREQKRILRCSPLQHTSGNIGTPRKYNEENYSQDSYDGFKQKQVCSQSVDEFREPTELEDLGYGQVVGSTIVQNLASASPSTGRHAEPVFANSESYRKYRGRETVQRCKDTQHEIWSERAEDLFQQFVLIIPPIFDRTQIVCRLLMPHPVEIKKGRNELLAYLLSKHNPPVQYRRKIISSHIQVIAKQLRNDGNMQALGHMKTSTTLVKSKDIWFDEASMSLIQGEQTLTSGSRSGILSGIHMPHYNEAWQRSTRLVQTIDFRMGIYQKPVPPQLTHECTTLQTPGGGAAKPISEIIPFLPLFPLLQGILDHEPDCEIIWFECSLNVLNEMPSTNSHLAIDFTVDLANEKRYTGWEYKTSFYHSSGTPTNDITRQPSRIEVVGDARVRLELSLSSTWWVKLFQVRIQKRQEAVAAHLSQLQQFSQTHGTGCVCLECSSLRDNVQIELRRQEEIWRQHFNQLSVMQSFYAIPDGHTEPQRVAVFLFKFSQARTIGRPLTTWHRVARPKMESDGDTQYYNNMYTQPVGVQHQVYNDGTNDWMGGSYPVSASSSEDSYQHTLQQITPTDSTFSGHSNASGYSISQEYPCSINNGNNGDAIHQSASAQPTQYGHGSNNAYGSQPATDRPYQDTIYAQQTFVLPSNAAYLPQSQMVEFAFEDHDLLAAFQTADLPFDFNQPLEIPTHNHEAASNKLDHTSFEYQEDAGSAQVHAPQPQRVITTAHLSSPILMLGEHHHDDQPEALATTEEALEPADGHSDELCADAEYFDGLSQAQDAGYNYAPASNTEEVSALLDPGFVAPSLCDSNGSTYQSQRRSFDTDKSIHITEQAQDTQSIHSSAHQQLCLLASTYEPTPPTSDRPASAALQDVDSHQDDHGIISTHVYAVYDTQTSEDQSQSDHQQLGHDLQLAHVQTFHQPEWTTTAALDAHNWVLDLAIARTEDMIEQAHATDLEALADAAVLARVSEHDLATISLHSHSQEQYGLADNEAVGRILGEIEGESAQVEIKQEGCDDNDLKDSIPLPSTESDDEIDLQNLQQEDDFGQLSSIVSEINHGSAGPLKEGSHSINDGNFYYPDVESDLRHPLMQTGSSVADETHGFTSYEELHLGQALHTFHYNTPASPLTTEEWSNLEHHLPLPLFDQKQEMSDENMAYLQHELDIFVPLSPEVEMADVIEDSHDLVVVKIENEDEESSWPADVHPGTPRS